MKIVRLVSAYDEDQTTFHNEFNSDIILRPYSKVAVHNCTIPLIQNLFTVDSTLQNNQFVAKLLYNDTNLSATITIPDGEYTYDGLMTAIENALYGATELADYPLEFRANKATDTMRLDVRMPLLTGDFDPDATDYLRMNSVYDSAGMYPDQFDSEDGVNSFGLVSRYPLNKGNNSVLAWACCNDCPQFPEGAAEVPHDTPAKFYCGIVDQGTYVNKYDAHDLDRGFSVTDLDLVVYIDPATGFWKYNYGASTGNLVPAVTNRVWNGGATPSARNGDEASIVHNRAAGTIVIDITNDGVTYNTATITAADDADILSALKNGAYHCAIGVDTTSGAYPHFASFSPFAWTPSTGLPQGRGWESEFYVFSLDFTDYPLTRGFLGYSDTEIAEAPNADGIALLAAADRLTNVDDTRGILITIPSLPIDGYDGAVTDDRGQGQRLPVVGVIPVSNKIGSSIVHNPNDLLFCEIKNREEISLREIEWRYLTSKLQALQSRNTTLTLVFKDPNE